MFNGRLAETRSGATANEDLVGYTDAAAWVIDGASGAGENVVSAVSDAQWFAQRVDAELRELLASEPTMTFEDLFGTVVDRCRLDYSMLARRPPAGRQELPCAAIAFVRALPENVAQIGRAHVRTSVTTETLVCSRLLAQKHNTSHELPIP